MISSVGEDTEYLDSLLKSYNETKYKICGDTLFYESDKETVENVKKAVTRLVFDKYLARIIKDILYKEYHIGKKEQAEIMDALFLHSKKELENAAAEEIDEFIEKSTSITVSGFANFRLNEFKRLAGEKIKRCIEKRKNEEEYEKFIELINMYVDIQPPMVEKMHILVTEAGGYELYDEQKRDITKKCVGDIMAYYREDDFSMDDILLSILINCSPEQVHIHNHKYISNKNLMETIRKIFRERMVLCAGCSFCEK